MWKSTIGLAITALSIFATSVAQAQTYRFELLTLPDGASISANGLNLRGAVAGEAYDATYVRKAIVWKNGAPTELQGLGSHSAARAINDRGQSGGYSVDSSLTMQAVRWDGTVPTVLKHRLQVGPAYAVAINLRGQVAGNLGYLSGGGPTQAVRWDTPRQPTVLDSLAGTASVASGMNDSGDVVGYIVSPNGSGLREPVVWRGDTATLLKTLLDSPCCNEAAAINDSGQIVGWSSTPDVPLRAVVWNGGTPTALQSLSVADKALAVNNRQQAVGVLNAGGVTRAALWDLATGDGVDLNDFLPARYQQEGWSLEYALGINDRGVIVGVAFNPIKFVFVPYQLVPLTMP